MGMGSVGAVLAVATGVALHAHLVSSSPADGDVLEAAPREVRLVYSEPVEAALSRVTLVSAAGERQVPVRSDSTDVRVLVGPLPRLAVAEYRVDWRTVSADGHPVDGSLRFTVVGARAGSGDSAAAAPAPAPAHPAGRMSEHAHSGPNAPAAVSAALRGIALFSLLALTGWLLQLTSVDPAAHGGTRGAVLLAAATSALLAAHFAAWLWHVSAGVAPDIVAALRTGPGRIEALRTGLVVATLWALVLARRPMAGLAFAAAAVLVSGAAGHSAGIVPRWSIPLKSLHLLALAVWIGGVAWLAVAAIVDEPFRASATRVSSLALGAVVVVALTGVAQSVLFLPRLDALAGSSYGRLVLAKVLGLAGLVAFGAWNRRRILPRLLPAGGAPDPDAVRALRVSTRRELALMLIVSVVAGALAYVPPPA